MKRLLAIALLCLTALSAQGEDMSVEDALNAALHENGPFYAWTLEQKADFYNEHVYRNAGTRRGVPDDRHIAPDTIRVNAADLLAACLGCNAEELEPYTVDIDFWIEAFPGVEGVEHEYYSVCFLLPDAQGEVRRNVYQLMVSAYTGRVMEALNLETGWTWTKQAAN